jgi:hypothetical protein
MYEPQETELRVGCVLELKLPHDQKRPWPEACVQVLTSSTICLTFFCWQCTMSSRCLIRSRRLADASSSCWYLTERRNSSWVLTQSSHSSTRVTAFRNIVKHTKWNSKTHSSYQAYPRGQLHTDHPSQGEYRAHSCFHSQVLSCVIIVTILSRDTERVFFSPQGKNFLCGGLIQDENIQSVTLIKTQEKIWHQMTESWNVWNYSHSIDHLF